MEVCLIFSNQLFAEHPVFKKNSPLYLIDDGLKYGLDSQYPASFHRKKFILLKAAITEFLNEHNEKQITLLSHGYDEATKTESLLNQLPSEVSKVTYCELNDFILEKRLNTFAKGKGIELNQLPSPNFLTNLGWAESVLSKLKKPIMGSFYIQQRRKLEVLIDDDAKPLGGKWSFDDENRKKLPKGIQIPELPIPAERESVKNARKELRESGRGQGGHTPFEYPVNRVEALKWMHAFFKERFSLFGDYEDAISTQHRVQFHSVLTPMLNIGLLNPEEILDEALEVAEEENIPLNSLEGFVRQIIGWREYMRIMYHRHGVEMRTKNYWGFTRKIPESFYQGTTGIEPIDHVIKATLETGYCHHIERLMILGNFMLLCRFDPDEVYRWFMEMFIDSDDWVMVPNVYGMTQFADGGIFTTKPYISGSNYIKKMSDYKKGDWMDVWDALFWTFLEDHRDFFDGQARMGMLTRQIDKRKEKGTWDELRETAEKFLSDLDR